MTQRRRSALGRAGVAALVAGITVVPARSGTPHALAAAPEPVVAVSLGAALGPVTARIGPASATTRYLVTVRSSAGLEAVAADVMAAGGDVLRSWRHGSAGLVVELPEAAAADLRADVHVVTVEPDSRVRATTDQSGAPWGLDRIDQRNLPLNGTYSYASTGAGVTVYVVDSGIRSTHSQFGGRVSGGAYVDFGDGTGTQDCDGHGTHVAGTVGGSTYGVAKAVSLVPVKVLDCDGSGSVGDVIAGLDWIVSDHGPGEPAVVNMSLGGPASSALDAAVDALIADGVTVVVAAGNDGLPTCWYSPARVANAITVAASESDDDDADYANYGACNDLFAPGTGVLSAWYTSDSATATLSGTSMAAPHVAGAAARLLQGSPTATPAQVWALLDASATTGVLTTCCGDPNKLLYLAPSGPSAPSAPQSVQATAGVGEVAVTWLAPLVDGGSAVIGYEAKVDPGGATCTTTGALGCTITGLANGTSYAVTVRARNATGLGAASAPVIVGTPVGVPSAPVIYSASGGGSGSVYVVWWWVSDGGSPITDVDIEYSTEADFTPGTGTFFENGTTTGSEMWVTGLPLVTEHWYRVRVTNQFGDSQWSAAYSDEAIPQAPTGLTVTAISSGVRLDWTAPMPGTSPITDYYVFHAEEFAGYHLVSHPASPATTLDVTGLSMGVEHTFWVEAINVNGWSSESNLAKITLGAPAAPVVTAAPGDRTALLDWTTPPPSGFPLVDYLIQRSKNGGAWVMVHDGTKVASSYLASGLTNGATYQFRVAARTGLAIGTWSDPVTVLPRTVPGRPQSLSATGRHTSVVLTWKAPSSNGGAAVTDYRIQMSLDGVSWTTLDDGVSASPTVAVDGLTNGVRYRFRVAAINAAGVGSNTSSRTATPKLTVPGTPRSLAAVGGDGQVALSWKAPSADGGDTVSDYRIQMSVDGAAWVTVDDGVSAATSTVVGGLTNGVRHRFRVAAVNLAGPGANTSSRSATPTAT